jgi:predicted NUDIX family NTP pyrophosphohydrolase
MEQFPEIDQARFFDVDAAFRKIKETQRPLLERLAGHLK